MQRIETRRIMKSRTITTRWVDYMYAKGYHPLYKTIRLVLRHEKI